MRIKRALVSVSDKSGLVEFCKALREFRIEIIASSGTFEELVNAGIPAIELSHYTDFPELLDGRVKTLNRKVHAGILADRENKKHLMELKKHKIPLIDLVVVNLYPFGEVLRKTKSEQELIENIDIGGIALLRAAAKNYYSVAVVCDPNNYVEVIKELKKGKGEISLEERKSLAAKAFRETALYDSIISGYFSLPEEFPEGISLGVEKVQDCRYGENPHQKAAVYRRVLPEKNSILSFKQLHGKALSFNNFLDLNAAVSLAREFKDKCAVIVKHGNPCGVACSKKLSDAFRKALECDEKSAFGSVIALNSECDSGTAMQITSFFNEVVVAPSFEKSALKELKKKKSLRVIELPFWEPVKGIDFRRIEGGMLLQESDSINENPSCWKVVSEKKPSGNEMAGLEFAWRVAKHVKSNAIVVAREKATLGIGAGQMNRVNAVKIALENAGENCKGAVLASDGFFPFRDSIDLAAEWGVKAFISPGGSVRDSEVIGAANEKNVSLVFTGTRHFRH